MHFHPSSLPDDPGKIIILAGDWLNTRYMHTHLGYPLLQNYLVSSSPSSVPEYKLVNAHFLGYLAGHVKYHYILYTVETIPDTP